MVAFLCITMGKLMVFGQKTKIQTSFPQIYSPGGPHKGFWQETADPGVTQCDFCKSFNSCSLGHLILVFLTIFYDFLTILQPHSKFEPSKSIFSEISCFHSLIPIIACRSAKMAAKHLRGVP